MSWLKKYIKIISVFFAALIFISAVSNAEVIEGSVRREIKQTKQRTIQLPEKKIKLSNAAILAYNRGVGYFKKYDYDKSVESFKLAIKQEPRFADAYFNLGILYEYFQDYGKAVIAFNRAYVINKKDYESLFYMIKCYMIKGDKTAAYYYFKKMPSDSEFYKEAEALFNK